MSLLRNNSFDASVGLESSTSYVSVEEAKAYLNNLSKGSSLANLSDEDLQKKLNSSTQFINNEYNFIGKKATPDQALEFPREDQTEIPINIKYASIELAILINSEKVFVDPGDESLPVIESTVGPLTTKYATSQIQGEISKKNNLVFIRDLLKDYLCPNNNEFQRS